MIAMTRRMAIRDFLLVAMATLVIVLSNWPSGQQRQSVDLRNNDGTFQRYSLTVDDPRLVKLRRDLDAWNRGGTNTAIALTKWRAELAEFYVSRLRSPQNTEVAQVAFVDSGVEAGVAVSNSHQGSAGNDWQSYWANIGQQARESLAIQNEKLRDQRAILGPPIVLGTVSESRNANAFMISCVCGLLMAIVFGIWTYLSPTLGLRRNANPEQLEAHGESLASSHGRASTELQLRIPSEWVQIHQPISVVLRRISYAALVGAAMACILV